MNKKKYGCLYAVHKKSPPEFLSGRLVIGKVWWNEYKRYSDRKIGCWIRSRVGEISPEHGWKTALSHTGKIRYYD
jgi:hypothetical protein